MGDTAWGADGLHVEAPLELLEPVPETLTTSEDDGHDHDVHGVDQVGGEELADGRWASSDADVQATGSFPGNLQGLGGGSVDEVEGRLSFHRDRWPGVMGEDVHGGMEGRVVAPPALPLLVRPRSALGSE